MSSKEETTGKRRELRDKFGFDVKFAMNLVRLLYEGEMILTEGDLDLRRHSEHLKAIRRGEVSEQEIRTWAAEKEQQLEKVYIESKLPWGPNVSAIKKLLIECLEEHYGSLDKCIVKVDEAEFILKEIEQMIYKYNKSRS